MKKFLSLILAIVLMVGCIPLIAPTASAETGGDFYYYRNWGANGDYDGTCKITGYNGYAANLTIPSTIDGYKVTGIDGWVFKECGFLLSVTIPDSVTSIGNYAFYNCSALSSVKIGDGVTSIGESAFSGCSALSSVTLGDSVAQIGSYAFKDCDSLASLILPDSVRSIENGAFYNCELLGSINIPYGVVQIGDSIFYDCDCLTSITIPSSVVSIGAFAFEDCDSLSIVSIPNSVTSVGEKAFYSCENLWTVQMGKKVTQIGNEAFGYCNSLRSFTVPSSVTRIGDEAFFGCESLGAVYIPDSVTRIGEKAFEKDYSGYFPINLTLYCADGTAARNYAVTNGINYAAPCSHSYVSQENRVATVSLSGLEWKECSKCGNISATEYPRIVSFALSTTSYTYNGTVKTPNVTVKDAAGNKLTKNTDYTVTYPSGRKNAGTYKVTVKMKGNYSGTKTLTFKIKPIDISKCKLNLSTTVYTYNGKVKTPNVTVKNAGGTKLTKGTHYTVSYPSGRKKAGTYKVTVKMKGNYSGTKTLSFTILHNLSAPSSVKASLYGYDDVKVTWSKVANAAAYKVYYKKASSSAYKLKTTTTNLYCNFANLEDGVKYVFKVVPCSKANGKYYSDSSYKTTSVYTLKKVATPTITKYNKDKVKVRWSNISGESGYQISRSTSKSGTNIVATYTTTSGKYKIVSATKGKTYYYKVRTFKTVNGKKIYGPWSSVKAYKIK